MITRGPRRRALALAFLGLTAACDSPTAPEERLDVFARLIGTPSLMISLAEGVPTINCEVGFEVRAEGKGMAYWRSVSVKYYAGPELGAPLDSFDFDFAEYPIFRHAHITSAVTDTTLWRFTAGVPFRVEMTFRYQRRGESEHRDVLQRADCGLLVPPGAAPPSAQIVGVRGSDPVLEAGDTLIVHYRAQAGAPLWRSRISVSGPFDAMVETYEEMALQREGLVRVVVPRQTVRDEPIVVQLAIADVGFRTAEIESLTTLMVVDTKAPSVLSSNVGPLQLPAGFTLQLGVHATDDNDLAWIIWELDGPIGVRDSIGVREDSLLQWVSAPITVRPEWAGLSAGVTVWARDVVGHLSAPYRVGGVPLQFYRVAPTPGFASLSLGTGPEGLPLEPRDFAFDAKRDRVYVTVTADRLHVIDLATMTQLPSLAVPQYPGSIDLTVSGDSLVMTHVALSRLSVIDLDSLKLLPFLPLVGTDSEGGTGEIGFGATGVRVLANGRAMVKLANPTRSGDATIEVDLATATSRFRTDARDAHQMNEAWWKRMARTPDRRHLILLSSCGRRYDVDSDAFSACEPMPGEFRAERVALEPLGVRVVAGTAVLGPSLSTVQELVGDLFTNGDLYSDGEHALMIRGTSLLRVRLSDGRITAGLYLPINPTWVMILPDQMTAVVLSRNGVIGRVDISGLD